MNDQDASFLQFAEQHGLVIGATLRVVDRSMHADSLTIETGKETVVLGLSAASNIEVVNA